MDALVLESVCKSFGSVQAVQDLSVRVPAGCIHGFLGPNGAGKTTTLRMIMNILQPDAGRIERLGDGEAGVLDRIGYLPEERGLYRKMTVARTLHYLGSLKGVSSEQLRRRVPEWLERLGLEAWSGRKVENLSRGMQQKLQFAISAIHDPELMILDEPFSGLDPVNQDLVEQIILDMRQRGRTVLFSTHMMHQAQRLCDRLLLINRGRAVAAGGLAELQGRWPSKAVLLRLEGDGRFLGELPQVVEARESGGQWDITLAAEADAQQLLRAVVERASVLSFEVKRPSLHEIFIRLVGGEHEATD